MLLSRDVHLQYGWCDLPAVHLFGVLFPDCSSSAQHLPVLSVSVESVRMATGNDALRPGIHQRFAYVPHQEPIKCMAHCSQKRFLSVDDNSNLALWVNSMNRAGYHNLARRPLTLEPVAGAVFDRSSVQGHNQCSKRANCFCSSRATRHCHATYLRGQIPAIFCSLLG